MNYLILNGVNSNTIPGLLIQSLPPITKPAIRTGIEEIDGRDGDIVTKLGYAAYDKEISIGLHGNFNINNIIKYFNTEGTAIFSNEPDKYYNYQILEQIDYEKLLKFRTASVKLHIQPFKYSSEETSQVFLIENEDSVTVNNNGNYFSKPIITIYGSGTINLNVNNYQSIAIDLSNDSSITIDVNKMEAYKDGILKNRLVTGDYNNLVLDVGENTISWSGSVTEIVIEKVSRWI